jgi:hypothetical protein
MVIAGRNAAPISVGGLDANAPAPLSSASTPAQN